MSDDYGLARVAALRGRLLDGPTIGQLRGAATPAAFLRILEGTEDWAPIVRLVGPLGADPLAAAEAAIERHRSLRIGGLVRWFEPPTRPLVEALVLPLDAERLVALLRVRRSGATAEAIGTLVAPGALLGPAELGELARAATLTDLVVRLAVLGLVPAATLAGLIRAGEEAVDPAGWAAFEASLAEAVEAGRWAKAGGRSSNAAFVRALLRREAEDRAAVAAELEATGPVAAARLERALVLARLEGLVRRARREPLSIEPVAAYVAAVELQAIRLRAILARLRSGWAGDPFAVPAASLRRGSTVGRIPEPAATGGG